MHGWEGKPFDDIEALTRRRDPARFRVGCATRRENETVLQWFRSVPEMTQYLTRMEPQRWGVRGGDLLEMKPRLEEALTAVAIVGLTDPPRAAYNAVAQPTFSICWWGTFEGLCDGQGEWARGFLAQAGVAQLPAVDRASRLREHIRAASHR